MKTTTFPFLLLITLALASATLHAQVILRANGTSNTYALITSVLAPGANPIEVPDCNHSSFGNHIDQVFDNDLNRQVFRFFIHVEPDNDRCQVFDRQRNEIKTYGQSPENLLGREREIVEYKWQFKLPAGFQSSSRFTHIHQLKSVGGDFDSMPMYTLTTRKGNPDQLELRYAALDEQVTVKRTEIQPFLNQWVDVIERVTYGTNGSYSIEIKNTITGTILLTYENNSINNWRPGADFVRPKWGIYRGLVTTGDLRDEQVLFNNFSIEELGTLSTATNNNSDFKIIENPATDILHFQTSILGDYSLQINDLKGSIVKSGMQTNSNGTMQMDISDLSNGIYILSARFDQQTITQLFIVNR